MTTSSVSKLTACTVDLVGKVVGEHQGGAGALLAILQELQESHPQKYLPRETLEQIGVAADLPLSRIFSVVTFYAGFNLEPQGRSTISVCRGTACHTRGSRGLLERLQAALRLSAARGGAAEKQSLTTADGAVTLRTVACFGQCALAPVVEIDHAIFGHMTEHRLMDELQALDRREASA